jgi:hypothetical protein
MRLPMLSAVLGVAMLLTACSASATDSAPIPKPVTARQAALLEWAENVLTSACMRRAGFSTWIPQRTAPQLPDFQYVVDDVVWARKHGYGLDVIQQIDRYRQTDPNRRYTMRLPPARRHEYVAALNGRAPTGLRVELPNGSTVSASDQSCTSQAARSLYGDLQAWFTSSRISRFLPRIVYGEVVKDERYRTALAEWSSCVRRLGLNYQTPEALRAAALKPPSSRPKEIRYATIEAVCANQTSFAGAIRLLDQAASARVDRRYHKEVTAYRNLQRAALQRAATLLHQDIGEE